MRPPLSSSEQLILNVHSSKSSDAHFIAEETFHFNSKITFSKQDVQYSRSMRLKAIQMEIFCSLDRYLKIYKI